MDPPLADTFRPSEDETKGLIPRPSGTVKGERSEHQMGAGLALRLIPFILLFCSSQKSGDRAPVVVRVI